MMSCLNFLMRGIHWQCPFLRLILIMVLIIRYSNSEHEGKYVFSEEEKIELLNVLDLNKCLKQIQKLRSLQAWAPIPELPSNISTMILIHNRSALISRAGSLFTARLYRNI